MNKHLEELLRAAAKKFADKKKVASNPETQFRKGAEWMYDFLMNGSLADTYRQTLCRDVMNRQGTDEVEEFREVLYTMRSDEVAGWVRSLELRQILLPDDIKDEVFLIVGERRQ